MNYTDNSKLGIYKVGNEYFTNKLHAVLKASETNQDVEWDFYNQIFENTLSTYEKGSLSLDQLYKQRALQLRETYDYLVLHYSGGADSWNILNTFIKNNIKLDCVFIKWPLKAMDKGLYVPNNIDTSAYNFVSEWDYVIKNDIDWLKQNHPEIRVELFDWLENLSENFITDELFQSLNIPRFYLSNLLRYQGGSKTEKKLLDKNKKVGSIYGIDKPSIVEKNDQCYFKFIDYSFLLTSKLEYNNESVEYFYWTPNFPILAIEQAYKLFQFYKSNPQYRYKIKALSTIPNVKDWKIKNYFSKNQEEYNIAKFVVYPDWNWSRFQADKPIPGSDLMMSQKDVWLETTPEFKRIREIWYYHWQSYNKKIDKKFKLLDSQHIKPSYSKWHYLGNFF